MITMEFSPTLRRFESRVSVRRFEQSSEYNEGSEVFENEQRGEDNCAYFSTRRGQPPCRCAGVILPLRIYA
jgi:hypothetical protein